jgi:hypothetical protein
LAGTTHERSDTAEDADLAAADVIVPGDLTPMAETRIKRVEKDRLAGWIARKEDGSEIGGEGFRWNSRASARTVVWEADLAQALPFRFAPRDASHGGFSPSGVK